MSLRLPDRPSTFTTQSNKRGHDEFFTISSDPPMFSSDPPIFSTSIDDYQQPSRKRQRKGPWYEVEGKEELLMKKTRELPKGLKSRHHRRPLRKFDSGVYMGSDESLPSELSEASFEHEMACTTTNSKEIEALANDSVEDIDPDQGQAQWPTDSDSLHGEYLVEKAVQTMEDPGDFAGPVFPYWQQQPEVLRHFHIAQRKAQEKVFSCVDRGEEVIDLSNYYLGQIRTPTLRPLRFHIRQDPHPLTSMPAKFKRFTPSLTLLLSNNDLTMLPGELYHLKNLKVLSLRGNSIKELLPAIGQLTNLTELNIASNQLLHLPFDLLPLLQGLLHNITLYPNPFIKSMQSCGREVSVCNPMTVEAQNETPEMSYEFHHSSSTWPSFLDVTGKSMRQYPPSPDQFPSHCPKPAEVLTHTARPPTKAQQKTPSLLETVLRNLSHAPELAQLPFHIPATESPYLHALLQRTYYLNESGGQTCTICSTSFVVPRVEWVEWWARRGGEPVPFLRRGCSWACFPHADEEGVEMVGWRSSAEVEDQATGASDKESGGKQEWTEMLPRTGSDFEIL